MNYNQIKNFLLILLSISTTISACNSQEKIENASISYPFHISKITKLTLDSVYTEWDNIPAISLIANEKGEVIPETFEGSFKIAWTADGLAFYVDVQDDYLKEKEAPILQNDALELFISKEQGSKQMIQYIISPGITEAFPEARIEKVDYGTGQSFDKVKDMQVVADASETGYQLEGFIPFQSLGFSCQAGDTLALNFYINDADEKGKAIRHSWHIFPSTYNNRNAQYLLTLSEKAATPKLNCKVFLEDSTIYRFSIAGDKELIGQKVSFKSGGKALTELTLSSNGSYATGNLSIERETMPNVKDLTLCLDDRYDQPIDLLLVPIRYVNLPKPHRYEQAIQIFEAEDAINPPAKDGVLFIGSSSIRLWPNLAKDFPQYQVIQRGFGGSRTDDVLHFYNRIVTPYMPKIIVFFAGVNDINGGRSPEYVLANTEKFIQQVARDLPQTRIIILSITTSVRQKKSKAVHIETNTLLQEMIQKYPQVQYLDVRPDMMNEMGQPRPEIFSKDSTHMNPEGYKIWKRKLAPLLE